VERRESFKLGYSRENNDPGFGDTWFGTRDPEVDKSSVVARLVGGYRTNQASDYAPFPKNAERGWKPGQGPITEQGELFNWEQPRIKGLYKGENARKEDVGAMLGVAALESKKRWGVEPEPDKTLSPDGARVANKLTGRQHNINYQAHFEPDDLRQYGNETSEWVTDMARGYDTGHGESKVKPLRNVEVLEGSRFFRNKIASLRSENKNTLNTEGISLPSLGSLSRTKSFKQEVLPGMDKA
jgi:hypothetical protein